MATNPNPGPPEPAPVGHTRHGTLTLDQIAAALPGLARLMLEVSDRTWILYYAAQGGNWRLAHYQYRQLVNAFRLAAVTRPKHHDLIHQYESTWLLPLEAALVAKDLEGFQSAFFVAVDEANRIHARLNHAEIIWKLPPDSPKHLELGPTHAADLPVE